MTVVLFVGLLMLSLLFLGVVVGYGIGRIHQTRIMANTMMPDKDDMDDMIHQLMNQEASTEDDDDWVYDDND